MEELALMASTATIVHVKQASQDLIVNIKSTSVIHRHAKTVPHATNKIMIMNVIALTDFMENNAKIMSIGVHKILAIMERLVVKRKTTFLVIVRLDGREKCATLRWFRAKMQR
jgi:hypothetical protein